MNLRSSFIWMLGVIVLPAMASAGQITWNNAVDGNWNTATNWSPISVPGTGDSVIINLDGTYTVTLNQSTSAAHVIVGGGTGTQTLALSACVLTLTADATIANSGFLNLDNAIIYADSVITQGTTILSNGGKLNASVVNRGLLRARANNNLIGGTLHNAIGDTIRVEGYNNTGSLQVDSTFTNAGILELTNTDLYTAYQSTVVMPGVGDTLINTGTINTLPGTSGGQRNLNVNLDNRGTVQVDQLLYMSRNTGVHANSGTINITGADLILNGNSTYENTGTINIGAAHKFYLYGGTFTTSSGTMAGTGLVELAYTTANFPLTFTNGSSIHIDLNSVILSSDHFTNATDLNVYYSTINADSVINEGTIILSTNGILNASVANRGLLRARSPGNRIGGTLNNGIGDTIRVEGYNNTGSLQVDSTFTNAGILELTNTDLYTAYQSTVVMPGVGDTLINTGTINTLPGTSGGQRNLNVNLDNRGTVQVDQLLYMSRNTGVHANSGTINITGADLILNGNSTYENTGTINIGAAHKFYLYGGTFTTSSGTMAGTGLVELAYTTANFPLTFTNGSSIHIDLNSVILSSDHFTNATDLNVYYSTINADSVINEGTIILSTNGILNASVANRGLLRARSPGNRIGGTLNNGIGDTIRVEGYNNTGSLQVDSTFTNAGILELTNTDLYTAYQSTVVMPGSGDILINTGSILTLFGNKGGNRNLNVNLDNQGTVQVEQPLYMIRNSGVHSNSGSISITGGNLTLSSNSTFDNTGTVDIGAGYTFNLSGGTFTTSSGIMTGTGLFDLNSTTAHFPATFTNGGGISLNLDNTTLNTTHFTNVTDLTVFTSTINADSVINEGTLLLYTGGILNASVANRELLTARSSSNRIGGTLNNAVGDTIRVEGYNNTGILQVDSTFTNTGILELTNTDLYTAYQSTVVMPGTGDVLINSGIIKSLFGNKGGQRNLPVDLDNRALCR